MKRKTLLYGLFCFTYILSILGCSILLSMNEPTKQANNQKRQTLPMDSDWRFNLGDVQGAEQVDFDDNKWRAINLPHDWSIEPQSGGFRQTAPTGGAGGYVPAGVGWYRKHFTLPDSARGKQVWIEFDGVYENSSVWLNGRYLGNRPFGYISFHYDLTPYLVDGENILAVRVDNSNQPNSRWYSGSGIYRHVRLVITNPIHVGHWGIYVITPDVNEELATVLVRTKIENNSSSVAEEGFVRSILLDSQGREIARAETKHNAIEPNKALEVEQQIKVSKPSLWSIESPVLYTFQTAVFNKNELMDEIVTPIGIRKIEYDVDRGFLLNGKGVKMKGVCLHHDGGCVGAAVPICVWQRRLRILKEMGCNSIRTAHNPPSPEFLDLCDRMGFLIMDEAFDEWQIGKVTHGYNKYFDEWSERDLTAMLHRDRNHPSVVMWSIGNEVREQPRPGGHEVLRKLVDICHLKDPTRPVTQGCDNIAADGGSTTPEFLELLDIVGYNYVDRWHERRELYYGIDRHAHPNWKFVGTESVSVWGVRGGYSLGRDPNIIRPNYTFGMIRAGQLWKFVALHDYVIGDFMWTGIDYLGESRWPSKNASSGVIDLCGFPKDGYYFYKSQWTTEPMIHLFPHWNWPGREGQVIPVLCYSNCDAVELFLNGKSYGEKRLEFPRLGNSGSWARYERPPIYGTTADLHLSWDIPYTPGVIKAVGKKGGKEVCTAEVRTASEPAAIRLSIDKNAITADTQDVAHITVEIIDDAGIVVPTANNTVQFTIEGEGRIIGVDNGNPVDHDPFKAEQRRAFNGLCLAIVQSNNKPGIIRLTARSDGLKEASVEIKVRQ
jgi:beta-galactosidase